MWLVPADACGGGTRDESLRESAGKATLYLNLFPLSQKFYHLNSNDTRCIVLPNKNIAIPMLDYPRS